MSSKGFAAVGVAGLLLAGCGSGEPAWTPPPAKAAATPEPGYLAPPQVTAVTRAGGRINFTGTAAPGAQVMLGASSGETMSAESDAEGRWSASIAESASPKLFGLYMVVDGRTVQAQGYLAVTPAGRAAELRAGAGARVLAPGSRRPKVLALDFDRDGGAVVSGVGPAGADLGLRIDRAAGGVSAVNADGRYAIPVGRPLPPGDHAFEVSGEGGEDTLRVATARPVTPGGLFEAERLPGAWRINWMTPGGGVQATVIVDPRT